jgi:hypothetical protein
MLLWSELSAINAQIKHCFTSAQKPRHLEYSEGMQHLRNIGEVTHVEYFGKMNEVF